MEKQDKVKMERHTEITKKIVFLDGLSGVGKSMLVPIVNSLKYVELARLEHIYEYLCTLDYLKKIEPDAAEFMIRMMADLSQYDTMIARETNFRFNDCSSVFSSANSIKYIKRLFMQDGNIVLDRIQKEKPILHIWSHQVLPVMDLAFRSFGNRLKVVELVRHPLYLLRCWYSYIERYGVDGRDFTIWILNNGNNLPWFAHGWEDLYIKSTSFDRVIYSIDWLLKKSEDTVEKLNEGQRKQILFVPFEKFVLEPYLYLEKLCDLLDTETTRYTKKSLRKQGVPRKTIFDVSIREVFKRYGWVRPDRETTEKELFEQLRNDAKRKASKDAFNVLQRMCKKYEDEYGLWF
jgi:hypothetical protein